jgi:hypothetical protein
VIRDFHACDFLDQYYQFNTIKPVSAQYSDRSAYEDDLVWKAERAAESNWSRPRPSSIEIARMEAAIVWPARYLASRSAIAPRGAGHRIRALAIVTSVMLHTGSRFPVGSRSDGIARASISLPRCWGAMGWRCSEKGWLYPLIRRERRKPGAGSIP